jgi:hypothetical protein
MSKTSREIPLTQEERRELKTFTGSGMRSGKLLKWAEIILGLDTCEGRKPARTCNVFMCTEPLALWGHAEALAQRTKKETGHETSNGCLICGIWRRKR